MKSFAISLILGALFPLFTLAENAATRHADNCQQQGLMWDPEQYQCVSTNTKSQEENEFDRETRRSKGPTESQTQENTPTVHLEKSAPQVWGENCKAMTDSAANACDFDNNPTLRESVNLATSMKQQMENSVASSVKALCSKMSAMTQSMNAAAAAFNAYCTNSYLQCQQACAADLSQATSAMTTGMATQYDISEIKEVQRKCHGLSANLNYAKQNIQKYAQIESQKAQACNQAVSTIGGSGGGLGGGLEPCLKDPNSPACLKALGDQDCSNPASTNIICICARNSKDPRCGSGSGLGGLPYAKTRGADSGNAKLGDLGTSGMGLAGGGPDDLIAVPPGQDSGGPGGPRGGGGGGRGGGSFGPGQGGAVGKAGPGGTSLSGKTISGYGYGGRGGAGGGGSGAGGAGAYGRPGMPGLPGQGNGKNVDLRQFLPGGQMDPSRGLAGISGPDGITGPNSDIWKKINKRYFSVSPSLLP